MLIADDCTQPTRSGLYSVEATVVIAPWSLERIDTIGRFRLGDEWGYCAMPGWRGSGFGRLPVPDPPRTHFFAVSDGPVPLLAHATFDRYRIEIYDLRSGLRSQVVERPGAVRPPTRLELEQWWDVFDTFAAAERRTLREVGEDYLLGVAYDDDHVPYVIMFGLDRNP